MANVVKLKRGSGSDPTASDMVVGEPVIRTDTAELFFKKDNGQVAKVSGGGGGPDFKYLALRNAANNGSASYPAANFTLVTSGTTSAIIPASASALLVSVGGVIQQPNTGTSTPTTGFAIDSSTIKFGSNISAAPDFILYQESGGIGEPSDNTVSEAKLKVSNSPTNGYMLVAQSGNTGGLTWQAPVATSCTGNSATATALATARAINGVDFDGTAAITVTAAAGTLSGTTLKSTVVTSSLTSLGDLSGLTVNGNSSLRHILVQTDSTYDIGTTSTRYRNVYADAYYGDGSNLTGVTSVGGSVGVDFNDNVKARFGTGNDLEIFHNASNSVINDAGTGSLLLQLGGSTKFELTSTGAKVTGVATVSNGIVETAATVASNHTITTNYNAMSAGPVTVSATVTIPSGSVWTVV